MVILDTVDVGKILVLDGLANLGEGDTVGYTHALMDLPKVCININHAIEAYVLSG